MAMDSGHHPDSATELLKIFERSDDLVLLLDKQGKIIQANHACLEVLGISAATLNEMSIQEVDPGFPIAEMLLHRRIDGTFRSQGNDSYPVDISVAPCELNGRPYVLLVARKHSRAMRLMGTVLGAVPGRFGVINEELQLIPWSEYRTYEPSRSVTNLPSRDLRELLPPAIHEQVIASIREAFEDGRSSTEVTSKENPHQGGLLIFTRIEIDGNLFVAMLSVDISDRLKTEAALRESEARFRSIVEQSDDGIVLIDHDGRIAEWNAGQERITGIERCDVIGKPSWEVRVRSTPREQRSVDLIRRYERSIRRALKLGQASWIEETMEWELELPDGDRCNVETVSFPIQVDEQRMLGSISRDITESKQQARTLKEYADRLKALAARLADAQEAERVRCSAELHDQVGQGLTALDLTLTASLRHLIDQDGEARQHIEQALETTRETATRTRNLMADMRPTTLDEYGLEAALRWYTEHLGSQTEMRISFRADEDIPRLPSNTETALFRIAQEALTNALKHSEAQNVHVSLVLSNGSVEIVIQDDGQGFDDPSHMSGEERGWGLMIMDERAMAVGGRSVVESRPGQGTRVAVKVPQS